MPDQFTEEYYINLVTQNGLNLSYVPIDLRTHKVCLAAVTKNGTALYWVQNQTDEIINVALSNAPEASVFINKK